MPNTYNNNSTQASGSGQGVAQVGAIPTNIINPARGYIILPRSLWDNPAFGTIEELGWFVDLLFMASYKPREMYINGRRITLQRGQLYATTGYLCDRWNRSRPTIVKFLNRMQTLNTLTKVTLYTSISIITICNYESYQGSFNTSVNTSFNTLLNTSLYTNRNKDKDKYKINIENEDDNARAREEEKALTTETDGALVIDPYLHRVINDTFHNRALVEQFCMSVGISTEQCAKFAREVIAEWMMIADKPHQSPADARKHLLNTIRRKAQFAREHPSRETPEQAAANQHDFIMQLINQSINSL